MELSIALLSSLPVPLSFTATDGLRVLTSNATGDLHIFIYYWAG
jgi:hypothetical protein